MGNTKLFDDVDEMFVKKTTWTSETKVIGIECHEFLKKFEKREDVLSPLFELDDADLMIRVRNKRKVVTGLDHFDVELVNFSEKHQTLSASFIDWSGAQRRWKMKELNPDGGFMPVFLSYETYKSWAKENGDVFRLKATITLHKKVDAGQDGWIRLN